MPSLGASCAKQAHTLSGDRVHRTLGVACVVASLLGTAPLRAQQISLVADGQSTARPYEGKVGTRRTFICPANLEIKPIWGTDVYTEDSPICTAAVHAGVITQAQGGVVSVVIGEGRATYTGSKRDDVEAGSYASYPGSYTLDGTASGQIDWRTTAVGLPRGFATPLGLVCPPATSTVVAGVPDIFGTDIYSDTSPICVSALHAGLITLAGGTVSFVNRGAQPSFAATTRNSVTSRANGPWAGSFSLSPAPQSLSRSAPIASTTTLTPPTDPPPQPVERTTFNRAPAVIAAPTGLSAYARNNTGGAIGLTWMPVAGALTYRLTRVRNTGDPETTIVEAPVSEFATFNGLGADLSMVRGYCDAGDVAKYGDQAHCAYLDSDMTAGTTYSYRVYALFADGVISPPSAPVTIKTLKR